MQDQDHKQLKPKPGFRCWDCKWFGHTGGHGSSDWGICEYPKSFAKIVFDSDVCEKFTPNLKDGKILHF